MVAVTIVSEKFNHVFYYHSHQCLNLSSFAIIIFLRAMLLCCYNGGQKSLGQLLKTFPKQRRDILHPNLHVVVRTSFVIIQVCQLTLPSLPPPIMYNIVKNKQLSGLGKVH